MKFLLISATNRYTESADKFKTTFFSSVWPPLGLLYLAGILEKNGHKVEILDLGMEMPSIEQLKNSVLSSDAIGLGVYYHNYKASTDIAQKIKKLDPCIPLIIGGPHCTFLHRQSMIDIPVADISVKGEAEHTIIEIAKALRGRKKLSEVRGILYRENNDIKSGKPVEIIKDLDSLPFPARHHVYNYDYGKFFGKSMFRKKFTTMITSRGCPFHCRFCARYTHAIKNYRYRQRSVKNIVDELQEINEKYNSVMIVDDNFLANKNRAQKIFDDIIKLELDIDLLIQGARVDSADKELFKKMKKAGVKYLQFGIESGNQDVLDLYNKEITLNQVRKAVKLSNKMGFITIGNFMFGAPIETKKHLKRTIKFACSLPLDVAVFVCLHYQMGSDLWVDAVKNNKIDENEYVVMADSSRGLGFFTEEELKELTYKAYRKFYLRSRFIARQIIRAAERKDFNPLKYEIKFIRKRVKERLNKNNAVFSQKKLDYFSNI